MPQRNNKTKKPTKTTRAKAISWTAVEEPTRYPWWWWLAFAYISVTLTLLFESPRVR
jgi:hypothetical protein